MTNSTREKYDQLWSGAFGDIQRLGPVHRRQTEELLKLVTRLNVRTVLDVGCGSGDSLAALEHAMPQLELSGVDVSPEARPGRERVDALSGVELPRIRSARPGRRAAVRRSQRRGRDRRSPRAE
jgi:ubiquinone/menaquinone biosynthesis C-methylase UbiE